MPANYAHFRFGQGCGENSLLFATGLHGPDILFYHNPVFPDKINRLGNALHKMSGKEFFAFAKRNCKVLTQQDLEYLRGVTCHYTLDSFCHPKVQQFIENNNLTHLQIESSFDRYLMVLDKKDPLRTQCPKHLSADADTIAKIYGIQVKHVRNALRSMLFCCKFFTTANPVKRGLLQTGFAITGHYRQVSGLLISKKRNRATEICDNSLYEQYKKAQTVLPQRIESVMQYMKNDVPLGDEFNHTFGAD